MCRRPPGDSPAAGLHLAAAREQIPTLEERAGLEAPPLLAEHLLALRQPEPALDLIERTLPTQARDRRVADLMVMWGARAAAALADLARDRPGGASLASAGERLERVVTLRASQQGTPWAAAGPEDLVQPAREAIYAAEVARLRGTADPDTWTAVAERCHAAALIWEEQLASMQLARSLLATGAGQSAAAPLRKVHRYAAREGAAGLQEKVRALATTARISLTDPGSAAHPRSPSTGPLAQLTNREREVLDHLVAGRTYAEIAAALFVSEKTVSTHVSNLLRKTGTSSRLEVSALALRLRDEEQQPGWAVADT